MSKRSADLLIDDILEAIQKVEQYIMGCSREKFLSDSKTQDAVMRNLEIIGEASRRLPDDFKQKNKEIEWEKIVGFRHRIVHEYFGIDLEIVWAILQNDLPKFKNELLKLK